MFAPDYRYLTPENRAKAERLFLRQMKAHTLRIESECALKDEPEQDRDGQPYISTDSVHRNIEVLSRLLCISRVTRANNGDYEYETPMTETAREAISIALASNVEILTVEKIQE